MTAYNQSTATYHSTDLAPIVIDGIGTGFAAVIGFASLVALSILYVYFRKNL